MLKGAKEYCRRLRARLRSIKPKFELYFHDIRAKSNPDGSVSSDLEAAEHRIKGKHLLLVEASSPSSTLGLQCRRTFVTPVKLSKP